MDSIGQVPWIIAASRARALIGEGALVLDAREPPLQAEAPVPGAVAVRWEDFAEPQLPAMGNLLRDADELTRRLRAAGVTADRPVIVLADPALGWGEDGRFVWMLRTLGGAAAMLIDGGLPALLARGPLPAIAPAAPGDFAIRRDDRWEIDRAGVRARLDDASATFLDVREPREFAGATPYGESRGGRAARGVDDEREIVCYCTGGVRAAFATAVLVHLGYRARNYAGSMWEWSAAPAASHPLVPGGKMR
jgi:thiosulfate/3-mercaptopyruvate sulfurtransferase